MDEHEQAERERAALRAWLDQMTPEGRAAFFEVYDRLAEVGLQRLAEHPEEACPLRHGVAHNDRRQD